MKESSKHRPAKISLFAKAVEIRLAAFSMIYAVIIKIFAMVGNGQLQENVRKTSP